MKENNQFLEYTVYNNNLYGTSLEEVTRVLEAGRHPLMDLDLNGVSSSFKALGKENYFGVWIDAPEKKILLERLLHR